MEGFPTFCSEPTPFHLHSTPPALSVWPDTLQGMNGTENAPAGASKSAEASKSKSNQSSKDAASKNAIKDKPALKKFKNLTLTQLIASAKLKEEVSKVVPTPRIIAQFIRNGADASWTNLAGNEFSSMHIAAASNQVAILEYMIESGSDLDVYGVSFISVLYVFPFFCFFLNLFLVSVWLLCFVGCAMGQGLLPVRPAFHSHFFPLLFCGFLWLHRVNSSHPVLCCRRTHPVFPLSIITYLFIFSS